MVTAKGPRLVFVLALLGISLPVASTGCAVGWKPESRTHRLTIRDYLAPQGAGPVATRGVAAPVGEAAWPGQQEGPKDPTELGYQPVQVQTEDAHYNVFEVAERSWEQSDIAKAYGPKSDYGKDVSPQGIAGDVQRLIRQLARSTTLVGPAGAIENGTLLRKSLLAELHLLLDATRSTSNAMDLVSQRFRPVRRLQGKVVSGMIFFEGSKTQVVLRQQTMTSGPGGISVPGEAIHYATIGQAIDVRTVCALVEHVFAEVRKAPFERVTARLSTIDRAWQNYLERGFSQYPWESAVNSTITPWIFGEYSWYDPPTSQLVVLHPEVGTLLDVRGTSGEGADPALLVHGLGYIRYFGDEREWFLGLSGTASFGDDEAGIGYGPSLHFGHVKLSSKIPHISLSVLWQDYDKGDKGPILAISVDLWRMVSKGPGEAFRSVLK
jgi:hypothetical protein